MYGFTDHVAIYKVSSNNCDNIVWSVVLNKLLRMIVGSYIWL